MPKIYLTSKSRQQDLIARHIKAKKALVGCSTEEIAQALGISDRAARYRLASGNVTLLDLWQLRNVLPFTEAEIEDMIGGKT